MANSQELKLHITFSGGGFRSTFYCLGAFRRLVELGLWDKVERIDSVSGGSITAGAIMTALGNGEFKNIEDFDNRVTKPLKRLGQSRLREWIVYPVLITVLLVVLIYILVYLLVVIRVSVFIAPNGLIWIAIAAFSITVIFVIVGILALVKIIKPSSLRSKLFRLLIDSWFFKKKKKKKMCDLPQHPVWSANTTCLNTGKRFRFKQTNFGGNYGVNSSGDPISAITYDNKDISISFAVTASAAYPFVFAPFKLNLRGRSFYKRINNKEEPLTLSFKEAFLTDGGNYDNLGSEKILQQGEHSSGGNEKNPFIIIDAGQKLDELPVDTNPDWFERNMRIIETALDQIVALRRRLIYEEIKDSPPDQTPGAMIILGNPIEDEKKSVHMPPYDLFIDEKEIDKLVADLRTDLDGFTDIEIGMLMWAGAVRMDIALKKYLRKYITDDQFNNVPEKPKFPESKIKEVLKRGGKRGIITPTQWILKDA